jgi:hypothetical protein
MRNVKAKKSPIDPLNDKISIHRLRYLDTGKYFKQKAAEHRYVQLDEDVHAQFPSAREVNDALREVVRFRNAIGQVAPQKQKSKKTA